MAKANLSAEIAQMIIDARTARRLTQKQLAKLAGTHQPGIARIEQGKALPSLSFLQKLAKAFNTQLLAPRLEFLEELKQLETYTTSGFFQGGDWTLEQLRAYKPRLTSNRTSLSNNKEFEYVS